MMSVKLDGLIKYSVECGFRLEAVDFKKHLREYIEDGYYRVVSHALDFLRKEYNKNRDRIRRKKIYKPFRVFDAAVVYKNGGFYVSFFGVEKEVGRWGRRIGWVIFYSPKFISYVPYMKWVYLLLKTMALVIPDKGKVNFYVEVYEHCGYGRIKFDVHYYSSECGVRKIGYVEVIEAGDRTEVNMHYEC